MVQDPYADLNSLLQERSRTGIPTGAGGKPDYEATIRRLAPQYGVDPDQAVRLFRFESGLNPKAKSGAGAYGIAQLMPATAKSLGVDINDPEQNIRGGLQYFARGLR